MGTSPIPTRHSSCCRVKCVGTAVLHTRPIAVSRAGSELVTVDLRRMSGNGINCEVEHLDPKGKDVVMACQES